MTETDSNEKSLPSSSTLRLHGSPLLNGSVQQEVDSLAMFASGQGLGLSPGSASGLGLGSTLSALASPLRSPIPSAGYHHAQGLGPGSGPGPGLASGPGLSPAQGPGYGHMTPSDQHQRNVTLAIPSSPHPSSMPVTTQLTNHHTASSHSSSSSSSPSMVYINTTSPMPPSPYGQSQSSPSPSSNRHDISWLLSALSPSSDRTDKVAGNIPSVSSPVSIHWAPMYHPLIPPLHLTHQSYPHSPPHPLSTPYLTLAPSLLSTPPHTSLLSHFLPPPPSLPLPSSGPRNTSSCTLRRRIILGNQLCPNCLSSPRNI